MTRVEEHREYLWRMDAVAPQREQATQDTSGVVDDEWAADVSGVEGGSASSADIELRGAHGATRRKHVLGQTQSNAELHIIPPNREDTRGRALKPVLTEEIQLDQAALDAKQLAVSQERIEAVARQQALEAVAATNARRKSERASPPTRTKASVPMRAPAHFMDDEETAPDAPAFKPASSGRR